MKETLGQVLTVFTLAIASTLLGSSTIAQPNPPAAKPHYLAAVNGQSYAFSLTLPKRSKGYTKLSFSLMQADRSEIVSLPVRSTIVRAKTAIVPKSTFIDETGTLWVEFNSPVPANTALTVIFKTQQPLASGQYRYQIAAYPANGASAEFVDDRTFSAR